MPFYDLPSTILLFTTYFLTSYHLNFSIYHFQSTFMYIMFYLLPPSIQYLPASWFYYLPFPIFFYFYLLPSSIQYYYLPSWFYYLLLPNFFIFCLLFTSILILQFTMSVYYLPLPFYFLLLLHTFTTFYFYCYNILFTTEIIYLNNYFNPYENYKF